MIKLNTVYKAGKQEVKFQEKEPGIIYAEYGDEMVEGKMDGNTLKGIFQNKKVNVTGIMELSFHESGFEGRWKKGLEPGELKQKWNAILVESKEKNVSSEFVKTGFHVFTDEDGIRYEGEWENDEFISGKAEYIDEDGVKVIEDGEFKDLIITSGKITYENGTIEEGTFDEEGVLHGQGKQTYLDEDGGQVIEEGNFDHSILKEGKITWADGNCASGVFDEELELNGKGIYNWPNRDFQDGTWVNGEFKDGKARITHEDGEISEGIMKDGEWVEEEQEEEAIVNIITNDIENYESGSKYEGEFLNGIRHGKGICTWANGDFQDGTWVHGEFKDGKAKITHDDGEISEGMMKDGEWVEEELVTKYEGEFLNGIRHGKGKLILSEACYEGDFSNNMMHGKGKYTWDSGQFYEGDFVNGNFQGEGIMTFPDGDFKQGIWADDQFVSGIVKITLDDNRFYEGEWVDGERNGKGITTYTNGDFRQGIWADDKFVSGMGKIVNDNGSCYEGELVDGKRNGKGKYTWDSGQFYEGDFVNGNFNGEGIKSYPNGDYFKGVWRNNVFVSGVGKRVSDTGDCYEGEYYEGKYNGEGIYSKPNGDYRKGIWKNGEMIEGKWKIGDLILSPGEVVTLKSGNLEMTVESICDDSVKCIYVYRGKPTSEYYNVSLLKNKKN